MYSSELLPSVKLFLIYPSVFGRRIGACKKLRHLVPDVIYAKAAATKAEKCA